MNTQPNASRRHRAWQDEGGAETTHFIVLSALCILTLLAAVGLGLAVRDSGAGSAIARRLTRPVSGLTPGLPGTGPQQPGISGVHISAPNIQGVSIQAPSLSAPNMQGVSIQAPAIPAPAIPAPGIHGPTITTPIPGAPGAAMMAVPAVMLLIGVGIVLALAACSLVYFRARARARRAE